MKTAILTIILFSLLILPHEFGHFIAAKKFNVKVNEFSFGMGPKIYSKNKGETLFSLRLIPIGGYCAMEGENEESEEERAYNNKKPWQKLIILVAGATMNIVVAFLIVFLSYTISGQATRVIDDVTVSSPAYNAGLKSSDVILYIDDNKVKNWSDVGNFISEKNGEEVTFIVKRNNEKVSINVTPNKEEVFDENNVSLGYRYIVGIQSRVTHNPIIAVKSSVETTFGLVDLTVESLKMLFNGDASINDLAGPIGVVQIVDETKSYGFMSYLLIVALLSVNIGLLNLLPIPALDGGHVVFVLFTMITKKEVSKKVEASINAIGLFLLLFLAIIVAGNDISRIFM